MSEARWRHSCVSVPGSAHLKQNLPCQDAAAIVLAGRAQDAVIVALSDGAGSAEHAQEGARISVERWLHHFQTRLKSCEDPGAILETCTVRDIRLILDEIRNAVAKEARARGTEITAFSATLLGAVVTPKSALIAQIGDGAWVGVVRGVLGCITWPTTGEFAGQTTFATSPNAESALQIVHLNQPLSALAGFTDGLERQLLNFQSQLPEAGFFIPVFSSLQNANAAFFHQLETFLCSDRICELTDDDKSIALIVGAPKP